MRLFIFECNERTYKDCVEWKLFATKDDWALAVSHNDICLLFDYHSKTIHGVWKAESSCANLNPTAWGGKYPYQVRVSQISENIQSVPKINLNQLVVVPPKRTVENCIEGKRAEQIYEYFSSYKLPAEISSNAKGKQQPTTITHEGLVFRSRTEIKIYTALKKRDILFFANATAILASKSVKREPDFLICQNGKWGILEVMGDDFHTSANATADHERARLFKDYGIHCIEFYNATVCYNEPDKIVEDFLKRLAQF